MTRVEQNALYPFLGNNLRTDYYVEEAVKYILWNFAYQERKIGNSVCVCVCVCAPNSKIFVTKFLVCNFCSEKLHFSQKKKTISAPYYRISVVVPCVFQMDFRIMSVGIRYKIVPCATKRLDFS